MAARGIDPARLGEMGTGGVANAALLTEDENIVRPKNGG